jgi:DNA-binding NarL/FixJ family response regulator
MNPPAIKILLVDDQVVWRAELRQIIERQNDLEVIAEAPDGEIAVRLAQDTHPDVVVMDVHMPKVNGVEATRRIKADFPDMVVIAFSSSTQEDAMRRAGVSAYVLKEDAMDRLCEVIRLVWRESAGGRMTRNSRTGVSAH